MTPTYKHGSRLWQLLHVLAMISPSVADGNFVQSMRLRVHDTTCRNLEDCITRTENLARAKNQMKQSWNSTVRYESEETNSRNDMCYKGQQVDCENAALFASAYGTNHICDVTMPPGYCETVRMEVGLVICVRNRSNRVRIIVNNRYGKDILIRASSNCSDVTRLTTQMTSCGNTYPENTVFNISCWCRTRDYQRHERCPCLKNQVSLLLYRYNNINYICQ